MVLHPGIRRREARCARQFADCGRGAGRASGSRPDDDCLRASIRAMRAEDGLLLGVLDDDPTGSQAVHGVQVVTVLEEAAYQAALAGPAATCFVLTNTRSMEEPAAAEINVLAARGLVSVAGRRGARVQLVSRSDSTLRGHVMAEVTALDLVRRETARRGYDGVLLVPAFLEAGRLTAGISTGPGWAAAWSRWARPSSHGTPRSATAHRTCVTSWRTRAAARSGGATWAASAWPISGSAARSESASCWPGCGTAGGSWSTPPNTPTWTRSRPGC